MHQGSAYAGFSGGKLAAISEANGALRWEATVALPKGATEVERVTDSVGDPAAQGREICVAAYQGRVGCYDARQRDEIAVGRVNRHEGNVAFQVSQGSDEL